MIESLELLQGIIEDAVEVATCSVSRVTITAGDPGAPIGENCNVIWVFGDQVVDLNQTDPNACVVRSRFSMSYKIHVCYNDDPRDLTDEEHLAPADCFYELMDLVWCALVTAKDSGTFGSCEFVELEPLEVGPRQGLDVWALGGVTIPLECEVVAASA
jgi:hypothetical protein